MPTPVNMYALLHPRGGAPVSRFKSPATTNTRQVAFERFKRTRYGAATYPEWLVYDWLVRQRYEEYRDFYYQVPLGGGRTVKGGFVIDFIFGPSISGRRLPVEVWNTQFHTGAVFGDPVRQKVVDKIKREMMERIFGMSVYIWEPDLLGNVERTMRLAVQGVSTGKTP